MKHSFVPLFRSPEQAALQELHPNAFLLLAQIAVRARWEPCPIRGLAIGECFVGDFKKAGIASISGYRHAKKILKKAGLATFRTTNKGTIATLVDSTVFSLSAQAGDKQGDSPAAGQRQTSDTPATTNYNGKREYGYNDRKRAQPKKKYWGGYGDNIELD